MDYLWPFKILLLIIGFIHICGALEVIHLDTTQMSQEKLNWQTFSHTQQRQYNGWREGSWNAPDNSIIRTYRACDLVSSEVDNWLRMPYIERKDAQGLFIEVRFIMRKCTNHPSPDRLQQCKESIKLYYYKAESDFANAQRPSWDSHTYTLIDTLAPDITYEEMFDYSYINTEVVHIPLDLNGVYFAFQDLGACANIISIKVYSIICPSVTAKYAVFPNTTTGPNVASIENARGVCVEHAAIEAEPSYLCRSDGTWYYVSGGCQCMPGYEPASPNAKIEDQVACNACAAGYYKWSTGEQPCVECPLHSQAEISAAVECLCEEGYFRSHLDHKDRPCTRPPSAIRNLTVVSKSQSSINISWLAPVDDGGRRDLVYHVECVGCPGYHMCSPRCNNLNVTNVLVTGLNPNAGYKIVVYAENGVSSISEHPRLSEFVTVQTEPHGSNDNKLPSNTHTVSVVSLGPQELLVKWKSPNIPVINYILHYYPERSPKENTTVYTHKHNYTLKDLRIETQYIIHVRWNSSLGPGEYRTVSFNTGMKQESVSDDSPVAIIAGAAVAVLVCMIIVFVMVFIFLRRNHHACNDKTISDCDSLNYSNGKIAPVAGDGMLTLTGHGIPLCPHIDAFKQYIDPHQYEDPNEAVREFTKEIEASQITIESVIGGGEFGDVCKGFMGYADHKIPVAIKTLKPGASDKNRLDFLTEASIMGQFEDNNVIYLKGVVTKNNPIMIVTEYMENGSLDKFLRDNDAKFTMIQLVGMMRGIASGMAYLSDMGYVHRDLAARNILVNETLVCKVADFGLSREVESDDTDGAYTTKGGKIPVRWTAPEAIAYRKFTSASDVWSYGVVMWEIIAYGERPYWNWTNQDVIKAIDKNFRLPPPMDCPEMTYQLMLDCWQKERTCRPKFVDIVTSLDKLIRSPDLLKRIIKCESPTYESDNSMYDAHQPQNSLLNYPPQYPTQQRQQFGSCGTTVVYDTVDSWLIDIKMQRYCRQFHEAGYLQMEQVSTISKRDLEALGIVLAGHQNKILKSVASLRLNLSDSSRPNVSAMYV